MEKDSEEEKKHLKGAMKGESCLLKGGLGEGLGLSDVAGGGGGCGHVGMVGVDPSDHVITHSCTQ